MIQIKNQKLKYVIGFLLTLAIIHFIPHNAILSLVVLLIFWLFLFWPWSKTEQLIFLIASAFFLAQNYSVLSVGGFTFKHQDFLLMPSYEPFMWGFYFMFFKRFINEPQGPPRVDKKAVLGLILTAVSFAAFAKNSQLMLYSTLLSTGILLLMFHEKYDFIYAFTALAIGFIIEIFGVQTGLWSYPDPDILGIPYWFATMWLSAGILGRRFLIPLSETLIKKQGTPSSHDL